MRDPLTPTPGVIPALSRDPAQPRHLTMAETIALMPAIAPPPALDPQEYDHEAEEAVPGRQVTVARAYAFELSKRGVRVFACLVAFLLPLGAGALVEAHDAMSGWTYDLACCSDHDCYEITQADLEPVADGWRIRANGDVITTSDHRLKISGDGHWHRCSYGGNPASPTICLYVPAGG